MARKQSDLEKYCKQVLSGKIVACEKVKKVCQRLLNDIKTPYKQWHFDQDAAERPVRFIETFCHIPSGFDYQSECHCSKTQETFVLLVFYGGRKGICTPDACS